MMAWAAAAALAAGAAGAAEDGGWTKLFNGRDLEGWTPKIAGYELGENAFDTFRVEGGVLKVRYDRYDGFKNRFGHLFYKTPGSNYSLRVVYRFVGEQCPGGPGWALRNSGVMIHGQAPETMRKDQAFPVSIEVQILGGNGRDPRTTGNLCTPGTHVEMDGKLVTRHCISSTSKTVHGDAWVTLEIEVRGAGRIVHRIDGEKALEYSKPQYDPSDADARRLMGGGPALIGGGSISLQSESHPAEFRSVEIRPLDPAAP
jgi:hypothetical protein